MPLKDLLGDNVVDRHGKTEAVAEVASRSKLIGIYFSAHWCPPCRGFTPVLAEWYKAQKTAGAELEIVFVSSDRDDAAFKAYFGEMPWMAMPFDERDLKDELSTKFDVRGIPTLMFVDQDGKVITKDGRGHVSKGNNCAAILNSPRDSSEGGGKCIII